jgi:hypothetical protein
MKKFLLVIAVLVMSATAYAADTLTTFANMESTYVAYNVRYIWGWQTPYGGYLFRADSVHFVSPSHSLRFPGSNTDVAKNFLKVPSIHGPGTYQVHLNVKVKLVNIGRTNDSTWVSYTGIRGFCRDSNPGGPTMWEAWRTDTLPYDTLWHILDEDLMTIVLKTGDSLRVRDTLSQITIARLSVGDSSCVDDAYLTGTFTLNGVEEGPAEPKATVHVSGLRPGIYDLLGRRVDQMEHCGIYFVVGRDGSRTKVVHLR